jgi:multisubunit Na+/H+ antiporter MnhC subunit
MEYVALATGLLLVIIGLWGVLSRKNLIRIILGFTIFDTGLNISILTFGYIKGGTAPILDKAVGISDAASKIVDPVPQALVLTSIVIGFGITALMLAYAMKLHKEKGTLNIRDFNDLKG